MSAKFLRTEAGINYYHFCCPSCGAAGELGLEVLSRLPFPCPEECGATFVQWHHPTGVWCLQCVAQPVYQGGP